MFVLKVVLRQKVGRTKHGLLALPLLMLTGGMTFGSTAALGASISISSKNLTAYSTCYPMPVSTSDTVDADTYVDQTNATTNNGSATSMSIESKSTVNRRVYISFALTKCSPAIPSTATVRLATLRLWITALPSTCRTYDIFRVQSSWSETGITWNNQPFGTTLNNPASSQATAQLVSVGSSTCTTTATGYVSFNVTSDVQAFVAGTATNNGWMIRDDAEGSAGTAQTASFASKETNVITEEPQLIVTYQR